MRARVCVCGACIEPSRTPGIPEVRKFERTHWKIEMRAAGDTRALNNQRKQRSANATQQQEQQ